MREGFICALAYFLGMTLSKSLGFDYLQIILSFIIFLGTYELADYIYNKYKRKEQDEGDKQ